MSDDIKEVVWKNIKIIRARKRMSQKVVSRKAHLHPKSYERIERSPQNLTLENLDALAKAFNVSISELLNITESPNVKKSKTRYIRQSEAVQYAIEILELYKKSVE